MDSSFAYKHPCIVQDPLTPTHVILVGAAGTGNATSIQTSRVDLTDINDPKPTRIKSIEDEASWMPVAEMICDVFPRETWIDETPTFYVRQFGAKAFMSTFLSDGTVYKPSGLIPPLASARLYSSVGSYGQYKWVAARASAADPDTGSPWLGLSVYHDGTTPKLFRNARIQQFPAADARLSVGTYAPASGMPVFGHLTVFDSTGSKGLVYRTTSTHVGNTTLQALDYPFEVDMGGVVLTLDATSIAIGETGYIIDKASDGTTVLYSITPNSRSTTKLTPVPVNGNVPRFLPSRASTVVDSNKLLLFGGEENNVLSTNFHKFDTSTHTWSGPWLVPVTAGQTPSTTEKSSSNVGAIAGGVAAGVAVLALAFFFIFRRLRKQRHMVVLPTSDTEHQSPKDQVPTVVMTDVAYQQQQQYPPPEHQYHQHVNSIYEPITYSPEQAYKQPLIYTPQDPIYPPQETASYPRDSMYHASPVSSATRETSPAVSAVHAEPASSLSPDTIRTIHSSVATPTNGPQYIPSGQENKQ